MFRLALILLAGGAALAATLALGARRWHAGTADLRARLLAAREPIATYVVDFAELEDLPAPVQKYLRTALTEGQGVVTEARFRHTGTFNTTESGENWKPFRSDQLIVTRRPGFDWDGRIAMAPGLAVRVHDAYLAGEGILHAALFGVITLTRLRDTTETAAGELMRFLAEAAWYPTVLLPGQGVRWQAVDERSARATLTDGGVSVTLVFHFGDDGMIEAVSTPARGRLVDGKIVPTPWQGRFWGYRREDGMLVPGEGEVGWILPSGARPYWRGRLAEASYRFAP